MPEHEDLVPHLRLVRVGDATIECRSVASGDLIVLLPAGGMDVRYLDDFAERLGRGGFFAVAVNPRGAGGSSGPLDGLTLHTFAADVAGVIDALGVGAAHVIGHGFSNRIVRCLVADRPDLVRSVVMLGGIGEIAMDPDVVKAMRAWFRADATEAECLDVMRYEVGDPSIAPHVLRQVMRYPALASALIAADRATPREQWAPFKSDAPVLVVQGLADRIAPRVDELMLRDQFGTGVRLVNLPQVGHMLCVEQPTAVADAVLSFLRAQ